MRNATQPRPQNIIDKRFNSSFYLIHSSVDWCVSRPILMHDSNETDQLLCYHPVSNCTGVAPAPVMVVVVIVGCQLQVVNVRNTLLGCLQLAKNVSRIGQGMCLCWVETRS